MLARDLEKYIAVGNKLKSKRGELNISSREVAEKLRIKEVYITAIEEGAVERIPSTAYLHGYVKNYSELLGKDDLEELLHQLKPVNENFSLRSLKIPFNADNLPSIPVLFISFLLSFVIVIIAFMKLNV